MSAVWSLYSYCRSGAVPSNIGTPGANGGHRRASSSAVAAVTSASAPSDAGRFPSGGRRGQPRGRRGRVGGAYAEAGAAGGGRTPCRVASRATLRLAVCRARRTGGGGIQYLSCERASAVPAEGACENDELQFVDRRASLRTFHLRRRFVSSDDVGTADASRRDDTPRRARRLSTHNAAMPRILEPVTVVKTPEVDITEYAGNGSSGQPAISIAKVVAQGGWAEPWQTPEFDEWVLVQEGKVHIEHSHGPTVEVTAGQAVYLAKGERVRWVFPEGGATYVPICLPGFSPANVHREDPGVAPPPHDKHVDIYHMVQTHNWEAAKSSEEKVYYPPTYPQDGFTHATADPKYLLTVGNHFYKDTKAPDGSGKPSAWKLLKMTRASLEAKKIDLKFEWPSPVGDVREMDDTQSGGERFPHIYGGIPVEGVVVAEYDVRRDDDGTFTAIVGL